MTTTLLPNRGFLPWVGLNTSMRCPQVPYVHVYQAKPVEHEPGFEVLSTVACSAFCSLLGNQRCAFIDLGKDSLSLMPESARDEATKRPDHRLGRWVLGGLHSRRSFPQHEGSVYVQAPTGPWWLSR